MTNQIEPDPLSCVQDLNFIGTPILAPTIDKVKACISEEYYKSRRGSRSHPNASIRNLRSSSRKHGQRNKDIKGASDNAKIIPSDQTNDHSLNASPDGIYQVNSCLGKKTAKNCERN